MAWYNVIQNNKDAKELIIYKEEAESLLNEQQTVIDQFGSQITELQLKIEAAASDKQVTLAELEQIKQQVNRLEELNNRNKQYLLDLGLNRNQWRDLAMFLHDNYVRGLVMLPKLRTKLDWEN
jgi:uncharacterized protein YbaP (TraB family)